MKIEEPALEELVALAHERLDLDPDRDRPVMKQLSAIGLTLRVWRNTSTRLGA